MTTLNTATSIIDFFKSRGLPSDFNYRKKIFESAGLTPEVGEYRGTANENPAFLNYLANQEKNLGVSISPSNLLDVVKARTTTQPTITQPAVSQQGTSAVAQPTTAVATAEAPSATPTADFLTSLGFNKVPTADELAQQAIEKFTSGATFPLQQEATEAEKAGIQVQAQADKEKFIKDLASKGLIFSGRKEVGLSTIEADTLSKMFGVDRKFALLITQGLQSAAQDIAKEAQQGNKDALTSLRSLGYDINPITGQIELTQTAKSAAATQARFEESQAATEARFQQAQAATEALAEQKLALSEAAGARAEAGAARSEEYLRLAEERAARAEAMGGLSQTQINTFAVGGIPANIATNIQTNLNNGATLEEIRTGLAQSLGNKDLAYQYLDKFMEISQKNAADDLLNALLGIKK